MASRLTIDPKAIERANHEIKEYLTQDATMNQREQASRRIRMAFDGMAKDFQLEGEVKTFGSFSNGFKTGTSDLDATGERNFCARQDRCQC